MKLHEYQGKEILRKYGVATPEGRVVRTADEAMAAAREIGGAGWVVKAQIHAGGRGKGGGIRHASTPQEAAAQAASLLGSTLVTPQTGPEGRKVRSVLIEERLAAQTELYAGVVLDRSLGRNVLMVSKAGGVEIEEILRDRPDLLLREKIASDGTLEPYQARRLIYGLGLPGSVSRPLQAFLQGLCTAFYREDCSLAEINPLILTGDSRALALDVKINLDDNAAFRHPHWEEFRDPEEEDPLEREAGRFGLSYIKLDGNIGCLVNGAGLAMATMDQIKGAGGKPANFLDVGGGATEEAVSRAFSILLSDADVRVVLINIFGGIARCDVIARGVVKAASGLRLEVPLVVRLEGTNAREGREILAGSGIPLTVVEGMQEAAEHAVDLGRN